MGKIARTTRHALQLIGDSGLEGLPIERYERIAKTSIAPKPPRMQRLIKERWVQIEEGRYYLTPKGRKVQGEPVLDDPEQLASAPYVAYKVVNRELRILEGHVLQIYLYDKNYNLLSQVHATADEASDLPGEWKSWGDIFRGEQTTAFKRGVRAPAKSVER